MDPYTASAMLAANAASNVLNRVGQSKGLDAYGRSMQTSLDEYGELAQGQFDWTQEQYSPQVGYGNQAMEDMWSGIQNDEFVLPDSEFEYDQDVNDFLSPAMAFEQAEAKKALEGTYGGSSLLSGPAMAELMGRSQDIGRTGYGAAHDRMTGDRSFKYGQFNDGLNRRRQGMQDKLVQLGGMVDLGQKGMVNIGTSRQNLTSANQDVAMTRGQISGQQAADDASFWYDIAGGVLGSTGQAATMLNTSMPSQGNVAPQPYQSGSFTAPTGQQATSLTASGFNPSLHGQMNGWDQPQGNLDINTSIWDM